MKAMKIWRLAIAMLAALSLASCGDNESEWADPEAHENTEQLREQYMPFIIGTWHYENIGDKQRVFEQLTFNADGTFIGCRKWQERTAVIIDGQKHYSDWHIVWHPIDMFFTGTWFLVWERNRKGVGENLLQLYAQYDLTDIINTTPYNNLLLFDYADATTLRFAGMWQDSDGWTCYERGEAEPSF